MSFNFTASHSFPYMKKRIEIVKKTDSVLHPIEVAIDEMQSKVVDIREVVNLSRPDLKKLQLKLQGSVSAQVNTRYICWTNIDRDIMTIRYAHIFMVNL